MTHVAKWQGLGSLRSALIFRVVTPLVAIMIGFGYLLLWTVEQSSERRLQEEVELVARAIRLPLSYGLEKNREDNIEQALQSVLGVGHVYGAYVYDDDGKLIAASGAVTPDEDESTMQELAAVGELTGEYQNIKGRAVYSYFVPLEESGGRINGLLQVTRRQSDFEKNIRGLRLLAGSLSGLLAVVAITVILLGHRSAIGKHLQRLSNSMAQVAAGERTHRAPQTGPREVAALGGALNDMLDSIASAERSLIEQKARETQLEERLRRSEQLAAVGRLAAGVAHELGSPLSVIDGKAQRALRKDGMNREQRQTLMQIRREVERLSNIIRQLLDFGRAAGKSPRRIPVESLMRSAAAAVDDELVAQNATLQLEPPPTPLYCMADPARLEQALTNLLRNAAQASPNGHVQLRWWSQGRQLILQVEDDGDGVDQQHQNALFEPFFTTKPVGKGSGLGLAVVHGVVAEHDGRVELVQGQLAGAAFRITLPLGES